MVTGADGRESPPVAIVNETMERLYLGGDAIGKVIAQGGDPARSDKVVRCG